MAWPNLLDYFGWVQNPWIQALAILAAGLFAAFIVHMALSMMMGHLTKKTKTDLDDKIWAIAIRPMYVLFIVAAVNIAAVTVQSAIMDDAWVNNAFFIIYTGIFAYFISSLFNLLVTRWLKVQKKVEKAPKLLGKIFSATIYLIAAIVVLNRLNIEITPFIATLGIGGLAVGLALQNTLSNFFAGLHIISDEPVKVGDYIELQGTADVAGTVEDIGWRSTRIKTPSNNVIIIPNSKLADSIIINDTLHDKEMSFVVRCGVSYDSDLDKVEKAAVEVAKKVMKSVEGGISNFTPLVRFHTFGDSNIEFNIVLRAKEYSSKFLLSHEFIKALKAEFDRKGIEISYPVRKVHSYPAKQGKK